MTLNEIEQRLDALQAEKDKLTAELERLKAEEQSKEVKPWSADEDERYYAIAATSEILELAGDFGKGCDEMFSCGNYYRTRKLAEQDAKELTLRGRVRQLRDALCEGYQFINSGYNWCLVYNTQNCKFEAKVSGFYYTVGEIYFDTEEHAQQVCDVLNAERKRDT